MEGYLQIQNTQKNNQNTIIKVIGVGGGGGNAVDYMYSLNVANISYLLCNTDRQHLNSCKVPNTICLGAGLGAGNKPEVAQQAAIDSAEEIREALSDGTQMVFVTAGMGGGTGTGAAPVIAGIAKEMDILTVGIVTIPFLFEGKQKILKAIRGVEELRKNVDAMLVVKNEKLREVFPGMSLSDAFRRADQTLSTSTRSISELVTIPGIINVDFADVRTTLKDGGVSIIIRGFASKEEGVEVAMDNALKSPLVNTDNFHQALRVLFLISFKPGCGPDVDVTESIKNTITAQLNPEFEMIWGICERDDEGMENDICFTLLASGFHADAMELKEYEDSETRAKKERQEKEMIESYYGDSEIDLIGRAHYNTLVFSDSEMDDNDFITFVIDTPTLVMWMK